jgi:hypothetical protein
VLALRGVRIDAKPVIPVTSQANAADNDAAARVAEGECPS